MHSKSSNPTVMIVEDDPKAREILGRWLTHFGYDLVVAADGLEAVQAFPRQPVDVVVTDLKMPGLTGLQLLSILKELDPAVEIVIISGQATINDAIEALRGGRAFDFLQKPVRDYHELNLVLQKALMKRRTAEAPAPAAQPAVPPASEGVLERLSERERAIVALLVEGLDNREIGRRLALSEKTIKNHLTRIYEKLEVENRAQAIALCLRRGA